jgi:hypothetical protein
MRRFRYTLVALAGFLSIQFCWFFLTELYHYGPNQLPTDAIAAESGARQRQAAERAASIGVVRGDLWADAAFTYAHLLWSAVDRQDVTRLTQLQQVRNELYLALKYSPHLSNAWLLLAGLASRYSFAGIDPEEALKMCYYTNPNDPELAPIRLRIAAQLDLIKDIDLQKFIAHDVRILLAAHQSAAVIAAYNGGSPVGQHLIATTAHNIDPSTFGSLHPQVPSSAN